MIYTFREKVKEDEGLTLVELLAVIVILGIIAGIATPAIGKIIDNSRIKAAKSEAIIMLGAANLYYAENFVEYDDQFHAATLPNLVALGYMSDGGYLNSSSYVSNTHPSKICAAPEGKSKVFFYNATAIEIADSGNKIHVGKEKCGSQNLEPPMD